MDGLVKNQAMISLLHQFFASKQELDFWPWVSWPEIAEDGRVGMFWKNSGQSWL